MHVAVLSHWKLPHDTKESCSFPDTRQFRRDRTNEKPSKKERSTRQLNQNTNRQTDKPSTSHGTMIDCDNRRYDLNVPDEKLENLSSLSHAFPGDESDNVIHRTPNIKVRTWLHSYIDKTDNWIAESETTSIEDKARPTNPISDGKSDELFEVYRDASRRPSQDRERSTNRPERIDEDDDALSQVTKGVRQIGEVIEIDSASSELRYNASHARVRAKESREKNERSKSETVNQDSSSSMTARDQVRQIVLSVPPCPSTSAIAEQSTANWSRVIEFGKEMKRARKRKVKKLDVSTEKNKKPPRIVENINLSPNSKYDTTRIVASHNKSEKEADVSNRLESNSRRKQDAIDKSSDLSGAKAKASSETNTELFDTDKTDNSKATGPMMSSSYITLEEGRKIHIMNLNEDQVSKIIGLENAAGDPENRRREENAVDNRDSSLSPQKRLSVLTPEKLNESVHEREIICGASQTSTDTFGSSSCRSAEKRTPEPRETDNVQETSSGAASSQLQPSSTSKTRLSLRRKGTSDNKSADSPLLSQVPLSYRISINKHEEDSDDRKSVNSPGSEDRELFDRLRVVRRDLNFKIIREDQQQTDRHTVSASALKSVIEVEDNEGNVSGIVRQDEKLGRNFTGESTVTKKSVSTKSRSVENQERRSLVKFIQQSSLIRRDRKSVV